MKTLKVIAAKGRRVPIHPRLATGVGGSLLVVGDDEAVELPNASGVRRRIRAGDLVEVKPAPHPVTPVARATVKES